MSLRWSYHIVSHVQIHVTIMTTDIQSVLSPRRNSLCWSLGVTSFWAFPNSGQPLIWSPFLEFWHFCKYFYKWNHVACNPLRPAFEFFTFYFSVVPCGMQDQTCGSWQRRVQSLNHWTPRQVPRLVLLNSLSRPLLRFTQWAVSISSSLLFVDK